MGNVLTKLKRFFANKNTVAILSVIAGILVLYIGYNWRISSATKPINIPYAKATLGSRHTITRDDIGMMEVAGSVLSKSKNIIRSSGQLIGKQVTYGNTIQENSFFFKDDIASTEDNLVASSVVYKMEDGFMPIQLQVNLHSTFGNAIYPGNYIDLWFEGKADDYSYIYGQFIQSIKVLDVVDSDGKSVFETTNESRSPAYLIFGIPDEMNTLIANAKKVGNLVAVPRNKSYTASNTNKSTKVSSSYLRAFVEAKALQVPDETNKDASEVNTTNGKEVVINE